MSNSPNLDSIAEVENVEEVNSESVAGNLETETRVVTTSEVQADTTSLDPFPSDGASLLSESPDIEETGPVALAAIENFNHLSSTAEPGFGTAIPPDYIYVPGDRPPPYSTDDSTSPLFSGRLVSPPVPGVKVTEPVSSSTPGQG